MSFGNSGGAGGGGGGWEIVGKKNRDKSGNVKSTKLTKAEKKNFIINSPKLEDLLPLNEVKSFYDSLDGNKENRKPTKEKDAKSKENEDEAKKRQQRSKQQQAEKNKKQQPQQQKPKEKPKSADKVGISVDELNELLESDRKTFPDAPLIWLRDLVSYLDAKLPTERGDDPSFSNKPETYPSSLIPKSVRAIIEKTIRAAGMENAKLCWEGTLATLVRNMTNGTPDMGCRAFLQLLAQIYPEITIANLEKLSSLRNSYQNKKAIGFSLLWAFSQSGKKNLGIGLTVWHKIMSPMLESRGYATLVLRILEDMLLAPKANACGLGYECYLDIVEDLCLRKINIPANSEDKLFCCMENLRLKMVKSEHANLPKIFESLLSKITPKTSPTCRDEFVKALVACIDDPRCLSLWSTLHPKHLYQSDLLLKQLLADWNTLRSNVQISALKEVLINFHTTTIPPKKGKEENFAISCIKTSKALVEKMSASKKAESTFPFKTGIVVLLFLIGAVVIYDCQRHGSFKASSTGIFLKNSGLIYYGTNALSSIASVKDQTLGYMKENYPEYYTIVAEYASKYFKLTGELYLVAKNLFVKIYIDVMRYVAEKIPLIAESIEHYFPGLLENLHKRSLVELERIKSYSSIIQEQLVTQSVKFVRWLETSVFVGNLSPDNIRGYATQAIDTTRNYASHTYDWVYEKVQTISKIH